MSSPEYAIDCIGCKYEELPRTYYRCQGCLDPDRLDVDGFGILWRD